MYYIMLLITSIKVNAHLNLNIYYTTSSLNNQGELANNLEEEIARTVYHVVFIS